MRSGGICFSYFAAPASYSFLEAIFMKDPVLVLNEFRTPSSKDDNKIVNQTVTAWLTKELQNYRNNRGGNTDCVASLLLPIINCALESGCGQYGRPHRLPVLRLQSVPYDLFREQADRQCAIQPRVA